VQEGSEEKEAMSVNGIHNDWLMSNSDWLLGLGGSFALDSGRCVRDFFVENPTEMAELIKAKKKKSGSEEAIAHSYSKAMGALKDLAGQIEKHSPHEFRELCQNIGKAPISQAPPPTSEAVPWGPAPTMPVRSSGRGGSVPTPPVTQPAFGGGRGGSVPTPPVTQPAFGGTRPNPKARAAALAMVPIGETHAFTTSNVDDAKKWVYGMFKKLPWAIKFGIFWTLAMMIGGCLFAVGAIPGLWVDLIFDIFWMVPEYIKFMIYEMAERLKFRSLLLLDQALGGRLGMAEGPQPAISSASRPSLHPPASESAMLYFFPFLSVYLPMCAIVWKYVSK